MPRGLGHAACPPWGFENSAWRKGCGPASLRGQGWATVPARCSPSREEAGLSRAGCGGVGGDLGAGGSVPSENTRVHGACVQALVAEGGVEVEADSRTVMTGRAQGACPRASRAECASQVRWSVFSSITQTHPSPVAPGNVALGTGHRCHLFLPSGLAWATSGPTAPGISSGQACPLCPQAPLRSGYGLHRHRAPTLLSLLKCPERYSLGSLTSGISIANRSDDHGNAHLFIKALVGKNAIKPHTNSL